MFVHIHRIICERGDMINDFVIHCRDRGSAGVGGSILLEIGDHLGIVETGVRYFTLQQRKKENTTSTSWNKLDILTLVIVRCKVRPPSDQSKSLFEGAPVVKE